MKSLEEEIEILRETVEKHKIPKPDPNKINLTSAGRCIYAYISFILYGVADCNNKRICDYKQGKGIKQKGEARYNATTLEKLGFGSPHRKEEFIEKIWAK